MFSTRFIKVLTNNKFCYLETIQVSELSSDSYSLKVSICVLFHLVTYGLGLEQSGFLTLRPHGCSVSVEGCGYEL